MGHLLLLYKALVASYFSTYDKSNIHITTIYALFVVTKKMHNPL